MAYLISWKYRAWFALIFEVLHDFVALWGCVNIYNLLLGYDLVCALLLRPDLLCIVGVWLDFLLCCCTHSSVRLIVNVLSCVQARERRSQLINLRQAVYSRNCRLRWQNKIKSKR